MYTNSVDVDALDSHQGHTPPPAAATPETMIIEYNVNVIREEEVMVQEDVSASDGEEFLEEEIVEEEEIIVEEYHEESVTMEEEEEEEITYEEETIRDDSEQDHAIVMGLAASSEYHAVCLTVTEDTEEEITSRLYHAMHLAMNTLEHREAEIYAKPPTYLSHPQDNKENVANTHTITDATEQNNYAVCLHVTDDNEEEVSSRLHGAMQLALDAFAKHELELLMPRPNPIPALPMPMALLAEPTMESLPVSPTEKKIVTTHVPTTEICDADNLEDTATENSASSSSSEVSTKDGLLSAMRAMVGIVFSQPVAIAFDSLQEEVTNTELVNAKSDSDQLSQQPLSTGASDHLSQQPVSTGMHHHHQPTDQFVLSEVNSSIATPLHSNLYNRDQEYSCSKDNPSDEDEEIFLWTPSPTGPLLQENTPTTRKHQVSTTDSSKLSNTVTQEKASSTNTGFLSPLRDEVELAPKDYQYSRLDVKPSSHPEQWRDEPCDEEASVTWDHEKLPRTLERAETIYESDFMVPPRWYKSQYEIEKATMVKDSIQVWVLRLFLALMVGAPFGVGTYYALSRADDSL
jgi:hypothetical protein